MQAQDDAPVLIGDEAPTRLHRYLASDRAPPNSMLLSALDGFLTGIAVGPEAIDESEWLPVIFGNEEPSFADAEEHDTLIGTILDRYDEIQQLISEDDLDPIFWVDRNGKKYAADWADGFMRAMALRRHEWEWLLKSERYGHLLDPILVAYRDGNGEPLVPPRDDPEKVMRCDETANLIPASALAIARCWPLKRGKRGAVPSALRSFVPYRAGPKVGRNDPCPCGSGNKFKKCCGKAA